MFKTFFILSENVIQAFRRQLILSKIPEAEASEITIQLHRQTYNMQPTFFVSIGFSKPHRISRY